MDKCYRIWTPKDATTPVLHWYDVADEDSFTEVNGELSAITDKASGNNGVSAVGDRGILEPHGNGKRRIQFDGSSKAITLDSEFDFVDKTVMVVGSKGAFPSGMGVLKSYTQSLQGVETLEFGDNLNLLGDPNNWSLFSGNVRLPFTTDILDNDVHIAQWYGGAVATSFVDGLLDVTTHTRTSTAPFNLGRIGHSYTGEICEVIAINGDISTEERQMYEGYLAWKWSIQDNLDVSHPYKSQPPMFIVEDPTGYSIKGQIDPTSNLLVSDIISKINIVIKDFNDKKYMVDEKISVINFVMTTYLSSLLLTYAREADVNLIEGVHKYNYPNDYVEAKQILFKGYREVPIHHQVFGEVSNYEYDDFINIRRGFIDTQIGLYNERVSQTEFEVFPKIEVAKIKTGANLHNGDAPLNANKDDIWISNTGHYFRCTEGYNYADYVSNIEIPAISRPDTALLFLARESGTKYLDVMILDGGSTGTPSLVKSGTGTFDDPYLYTFTLFTDNNSNDDIIALVDTDEDIDAFGVSATDASTIEPVGQTSLYNCTEKKWANFAIKFFYKATAPTLNLVTDSFPSELPAILRDGWAIARLSASELLRNDNPRESETQLTFGLQVVNQALYHYKKQKLPNKMSLRKHYKG